jgi:hypothetical protein
MNMQCEQFEQILEQQDEGPLPAPALAHVDACESCRALMSDFGSIRDLAMELDADGIAPPERVWISLRNQLAAERLIHGAPPAARITRHGWWAAFQRPAFAGAVLAVTLVAATMVSYPWGAPPLAVHLQPVVQPHSAFEQEPSPILSADSVFKEEVRTVGIDAASGMQRQDTAVTNSIRRNLQIVDNFIAMCEKSVHDQPDNQMAREYLYGAYEQKAELLATAMNRSMTGGLQ